MNSVSAADFESDDSNSQFPELSSPLRAFRILVVDDSENNARLLAMMLVLLGHRSRFTTGSRRALEIIKSYRPDIIISDLRMVDGDGCELVRRIRANPANIDVTLIAHTGFSDPAHRDRALDVGFDFYLVKPAEPTLLIPLLAQIAGSKSYADRQRLALSGSSLCPDRQGIRANCNRLSASQVMEQRADSLA